MASVTKTETALAWYSPDFYAQAHAKAASRVRWETHAGQRILFIDFSRAELDLIRAVAAECLYVNRTQPENSVLALCEVQDIPFHPEALKIGAELTERSQAYTRRTAVSGVTAFRTFLLQPIASAAKHPIRLFADKAPALEWLVKGE